MPPQSKNAENSCQREGNVCEPQLESSPILVIVDSCPKKGVGIQGKVGDGLMFVRLPWRTGYRMGLEGRRKVVLKLRQLNY